MMQPNVVLGPQELPHIARLCHLLEGLPLAIELAAGWVRVHSCQAIADQITRGCDVAALASHALPVRHRSLHTVFDYSWELLSESKRMSLRRTGIRLR
jgi:predicted ATPase